MKGQLKETKILSKYVQKHKKKFMKPELQGIAEEEDEESSSRASHRAAQVLPLIVPNPGNTSIHPMIKQEVI